MRSPHPNRNRKSSVESGLSRKEKMYNRIILLKNIEIYIPEGNGMFTFGAFQFASITVYIFKNDQKYMKFSFQPNSCIHEIFYIFCLPSEHIIQI